LAATRAVWTVALLAAPWLNPFSPLPSPAVGPLLFAWACAGLALLWWAPLGARQERWKAAPFADDIPAWWGWASVAWVLAAGLSAVIGLLQYFGHTAGLGGWVDGAALGEAYGNLRQRNQFATLMAIGWAALGWLYGQFLSVGGGARLARLVLLGLAFLLGVGSAASSSRTGLLQWAMLAGLGLLGNVRWTATGTAAALRTNARLVWWLGALGYVLALWALPRLAGLDPESTGAWARLRAGDPACASRLVLWGNVLHLIALKPWAGWGWGELGFAHFTTLYPGPRFCDILDNAHNLPLHLAVELGLPAAALATLAVLLAVWRAHPWAERRPSHQAAWMMLGALGLHSLLEYPLWYGPFQWVALLAVAHLLVGKPRPAWAYICKRFRPVAPVFIAQTAILIIVVCGVAAWQYELARQIYLPQPARWPSLRERTLEQTRGVFFYANPVAFAELTITALTPATAPALNTLALRMLHYSPEARVVRVLLDSAVLRQDRDQVAFFAPRFQTAFPEDYARWRAAQSPQVLGWLAQAASAGPAPLHDLS
jgi:O-antigen ligase